MTQDRFGTYLLLIASGWLAFLAFVAPGSDASDQFQWIAGETAIAVIIAAFFPRWLSMTGTLLQFSVLGLALHIAAVGTFGLGIAGLIPPILILLAMWLRRDRLDGRAAIVSTIVCGAAVVVPTMVLVGWVLIAIGNAIIWAVNRLKTIFRTTRQSLPPAHP